MKKFRYVISLFLVFSMVFSMAIFLTGCVNSDDIGDKTTLTSALEKAEEVENKKISTTAGISIVLYDASGDPMKITQQVFMERTRKDGAIYINGKIGTSEFVLNKYVKSLLNSFVLKKAPEDVANYIDGSVFGIFEIGYANGSVNARADVCSEGEEPDFKYVLNEEEYSLFIGAGFSDILAQQESMEFDFIENIDILSTIMKPLVPTIDFSELQNTLEAGINKGTGEYDFRYVIPGGSLLDIILDKVNEAYGEFIEKLEDEERLDFIKNAYDSYYEMAKGWVTIEDTVYTGSANKDGFLISSGYEAKVTIRIPDEDIYTIAKGLDIATEAEVAGMLSILHLIVTSHNGVKNVTEISFVLKIEETYDYDVEIDLTNAIFTPASEELEGRTVFRRELGEDEKYFWEGFGGDFSNMFRRRENNEDS